MKWQVWNVDPHLANSPNRPRGERARFAAPAGLEGGWLCFESGARKLRLVAVPDGWERLPDRKLDLLRRLARPGLKRRG